MRQKDAVAVMAGEFDLLGRQLLDHLIDSGMVTEQDEHAELQSIISENDLFMRAGCLEEVVMPTRQCQLACDYCGQEHNSTKLSVDAQDQTVARIAAKLRGAAERAEPYSSLRVGWFGAEPLLGLDVIRRMSPHLRMAAASANCSYSSHVVTNGFSLSGDLATELVQDHGVERIEITLDGPRAIHDRRRFTKGGQGSFTRILEGLVETVSRQIRGLTLSIRCNVDAKNADAVPELLRQLSSLGLAGCEMNFSPVYDWGNNAGDDALDPVVFGAEETAWMTEAAKLGFVVSFLPTRRHMVCVATHAESEVVTADGKRFSCTEQPYVAALDDDSGGTSVHVRLRAKASTPRPYTAFRNAVRSGEQSECHRCAMYPVCGGACPKAWADGRVPCPSFKREFRDRIAISVARSISGSSASE